MLIYSIDHFVLLSSILHHNVLVCSTLYSSVQPLHIPCDDILFQIPEHLSSLVLLVPIKHTRRTKKHILENIYRNCKSVSNLYLPAALRRALHIFVMSFYSVSPCLICIQSSIEQSFPSTLSRDCIFHNSLLTRIIFFPAFE